MFTELNRKIVGNFQQKNLQIDILIDRTRPASAEVEQAINELSGDFAALRVRAFDDPAAVQYGGWLAQGIKRPLGKLEITTDNDPAFTRDLWNILS